MISLNKYEGSGTQSQSFPKKESVVQFRAQQAASKLEIGWKVVSAAGQKMEMRYQKREHMYNCVPYETLIYQCRNGMLFLAKSPETPRISEVIK